MIFVGMIISYTGLVDKRITMYKLAGLDKFVIWSIWYWSYSIRWIQNKMIHIPEMLLKISSAKRWRFGLVCKSVCKIALNTLWPKQNCRQFPDDNLKCISLNEKNINFDENLTEVCSRGPDLQYSSIGSDNGLVPVKWQAIIWNNDG